MNINTFENLIDATILKRGRSYYLDGRVTNAYEQRENEYVFHIEGSDSYEVIVQIGEEGDILYSECTCPYGSGPVCKHEVAAYYELQNGLNFVTSTEKNLNKKAKKTTVKEVLTNLSKEELIHIIIDITKNDSTLKNSLLMKYSNGDSDQELRACKELINGIVRKYTAREGFIKYRDISAFVRELDEIAVKALNTDNVMVALDIAFLLLDVAIGAFQYADDSGGDIGYLVTETLEVIEEIIDNREESAQESQLFEKLLAKTDSKIFDGWIDFKIELFAICFAFAEDEASRQQLTDRIASHINESKTDRSTHYDNESMLELLFQLIEQYGKQEEVEQFIYEHLSYSSFREMLLNNFMQEEKYEKVVKYAKEGENQDHEYPGLLTKWKTFRYEAYKKLSLKKEQHALAKELFLKGDFGFYQDLKELASDNEFYKNLKSELKTGKDWHHESLFLKLIEEENDIEEMLDYVRNNPRYVEEYANKLVKHFEEEVIEIYKNYIKKKASSTSNRREYRGICQMIRKYQKIAGHTKQEEVINELKNLYIKRPAFIDELKKIR